MNAKLFGLIALAAVGLILATMACGGDGGPQIRVQRGLGVAAAAPQGGQEAAAPFTGQRTGVDKGGGGIGFAPGSFFQQGQAGLTVQGYGSATAAADGATLQLFLGPDFAFEGPLPLPTPECPPGAVCPAPEAVPQQPPTISEEDLAPIVAAIVAQGVAAGDVKVTLQPVFDKYGGPGSATIAVIVRDLSKLDAIVEAANKAADESDKVAVQNVNVLYSVGDCAALEREAMKAAAEDARDRAGLLAEVLGVGVGEVTAASHYSYSPFGGSPCDPGFLGIEFSAVSAYAPGQPAEVQVIANLSVTYAIE